jgi:hypothetical protein
VVFIGIRSGAGGPAAAPEGEAVATEEPTAEQAAEQPGPVAGGQEEGEEEKPPTVGEVEELLERVRAALQGNVPHTALDGGSAFLQAQLPLQQAAPPAESRRQAPPLQLDMDLTAILWSQEHPLAVINGRVVAEGDVVGTGVWVEQIQPTTVIVAYQYRGEDHQKELSLKKR